MSVLRSSLTKLVLLLCLGLALGGACGSSEEADLGQGFQELQVEIGEVEKETTTLGPVSVEVSLSTSEPMLGDLVEFRLHVEAEEGVDVTMPPQQEAFSRLDVDRISEERTEKEGKQIFEQIYVLQASQTGRLRTPALRVVFSDKRDGREGEEREILSEELSLKVVPFDESKAAELTPVRDDLVEYKGPSPWEKYRWVLWPVAGSLLVLTGVMLVRRSRKEPYVSPYERAEAALSRLEAEGLPTEESRDNWYVELSAIVRRYLEDRFGLRAPELTTEEFLRVAKASSKLRADHKALLSGFLASCDQVKFAGYAPDDEETASLLAAARKFLFETKEEEEEQEEEDRAA